MHKQTAVLDTFEVLYARVNASEYKGIDHYDVYDSFVGKSLGLISDNLQKLVCNNLFEVTTRLTEKSINSKGIALLILTNVNMYKFSGSAKFLREAQKLHSVLLESRSETEKLSFGYPFSWKSYKKILPPRTPTLVTCSFAISAIMALHQFVRDENYMSQIREIIDFCIEHFNLFQDSRGICFSYTEFDDSRVLNANYMFARNLYEYRTATRDNTYLKTEELLFSFCNSCQNSDGSWNYEDPIKTPDSLIDNYHTVFNLRSVHGIFPEVFQSGFNYYEDILMDEQIPFFSNRLRVPIDIHSIANATLLYIDIGDLGKARDILEWSFSHMRDDAGFFYFRLHTIPSRKISLNTEERKFRVLNFRKIHKGEFLRWSSAWMLLAMSSYLLKCSQD